MALPGRGKTNEQNMSSVLEWLKAQWVDGLGTWSYYMAERSEHCHYWGAGVGTVICPSLAPLFSSV